MSTPAPLSTTVPLRPLESSPAEVHYPSGDGWPMADNDAQREVILYAIDALKTRYQANPNVYVTGDLLMYYEEGNPRKSVAPDTMVVFGVEKGRRPSYKVWEEGKGPEFVLEVASPRTCGTTRVGSARCMRVLGWRSTGRLIHQEGSTGGTCWTPR